jgi:hypothetical protein
VAAFLVLELDRSTAAAVECSTNATESAAESAFLLEMSNLSPSIIRNTGRQLRASPPSGGGAFHFSSLTTRRRRL